MSKKLNVLFLPKWYPCRNRPLSGIFIKRHGEVLTGLCNVYVLYPIGDENLKRKWLDFEFSLEEGLETLRVYYKKKITGLNFLDYGLRSILYVIALIKGYYIMNRKFGKMDLVHVHVLLRPVLLAWYLKVFKKIPYLIAEHWTGYLPSDGTYDKQSALRKLFCWYAIKKSSHVTPDSTDLGVKMKEHGLLSDYTTIRNVVDTNVFKNYGVSTERRKKKIVHISSLNDQQKNVSGIIQAIKSVSEQREDFEVTIIGLGNDYKKLREETRKAGLLDKTVFFIGRKSGEKLARELSSADFLILFSNYENQPCVIGEALACEVPVLATKVGDIPFIITPSFGRLVEPGNINELIKEINYLLDHSSTFDKKELRAYAIQNYSNEVVGKRLFEIYSTILNLEKTA